MHISFNRILVRKINILWILEHCRVQVSLSHLILETIYSLYTIVIPFPSTPSPRPFFFKHLKRGIETLRRRRWHPTPVLLPGKSHGRRSLVGCSPWGHEESDTTERLHFHFSLFTFMHWRRKWQPTPVFLPEEPQGRRILVGCRLWGHTESDTTEAT